MIGDHADDPAVGGASMRAFVDHALQFGAKTLKRGDALVDGGDVAPRDGIGEVARLLRRRRQVEKRANVVDAEPELARVADEIEPTDFGIAVGAPV